MQLSVNTHDYDGKLANAGLPLALAENNFADLVLKLKSLNKDHALVTQVDACLELFLNNHAGNYDFSDNIHISQLLPSIFVKIAKAEEPSDTNFIWEQLADIITMGSCPQGRVKRLLQIYMCCKTE